MPTFEPRCQRFEPTGGCVAQRANEVAIIILVAAP
jgi:hypothetical protein